MGRGAGGRAGAPGAWPALPPPGPEAPPPEWTVSRVLSRTGVAPGAGRIIPPGGALLRRSSALTRSRAPRGARAGHPRPRPYSSLLREGLAPPPVTRLSRVGSYPTISPLPVPPPAALSPGSGPHRPSAVWFLWRFPSGHPGSPLATSLPCGARTFLPRAVVARRRSSVHLRRAEDIDRPGRTAIIPSGRPAGNGPVFPAPVPIREVGETKYTMTISHDVFWTSKKVFDRY